MTKEPKHTEKHKEKSQSAEYKLKHEAQGLGKIGILLGSRENAAVYIASLVLIAAIFLLGAVMVFDASLRSDIVAMISTLAAASLGYIGGLIKK
jgi:hypothetical protein